MARIDHLPEQQLAPIAPVPTRRRRAAWIAITAIALASAAALVVVPELASAGASPPAAGDHVLVCTSGVEQHGDIRTSSASATRVAEGDTTPPPPGCALK